MSARPRRFALWAVALLLGAAACGPLGFGAEAQTEVPAEPPTAVPQATLPPTELPTATPLPADTATPEPTATETPDPTSTALAEAAVTQAAILEMIAPDLERYGVSAEQGRLGWTHDTVEMRLDQYQERVIDVDYPEMVVGDFVVQADVTWSTTTGIAGCGYAVRADPGLNTNFAYEWFTVRLSGAPLWLFGKFTGQRVGSLISSGDAPTLDVGIDVTNTLAIVGVGRQFTFYINGREVGHATDDELPHGVVAFLAWQESGRTHCRFENGWLWVLDPGGDVQAN